jgi:hypothetical protein
LITDASLAIQESRKRGACSINASAMISACAVVSLFPFMPASYLDPSSPAGTHTDFSSEDMLPLNCWMRKLSSCAVHHTAVGLL